MITTTKTAWTNKPESCTTIIADDAAALRFLDKTDAPDDLDITPCWHWLGAKHSQHRGYGKFKLYGKTMNAHKAGYLLFRGNVADGLVLGHLCNNESCANPWHLEAQTQQANMRYCVESGRHPSQQAK